MARLGLEGDCDWWPEIFLREKNQKKVVCTVPSTGVYLFDPRRVFDPNGTRVCISLFEPIPRMC